MNVLDYIFIAILLIFTIRGFVRGLINEVFGIGSVIFSLFAGIMLYQKMAEVFSRSMSPLLFFGFTRITLRSGLSYCGLMKYARIPSTHSSSGRAETM